MTIVWVIGSGGLLGSALSRVLRSKGDAIFSPSQAFSWRDSSRLQSQFTAAVQSFALQVQLADNWEIYWAAGVGTMGSNAQQMIQETEAFSVFLKLLEVEPALTGTRGSIAFASSAGAIYAGCTHNIIDDDTAPAPTTPYAHEKLKQEALLRAFAARNNILSVLLARISTLYGPGGAIGKPQGLITHIARCMLRNQPIQIYVPLDTIRDYITADDAARMIVATVYETSQVPDVKTRIIASEQPTTVAEIVSIYKRITRRNPRIVTSASKLSAVYTRRIQFRTKIVSQGRLKPTTSLIVGIAGVMTAERGLYTNTKIISG